MDYVFLFHANQIQSTDTVAKLISLENVGIAAISPAHKLHEILFSEKMVKLRKDNEKRFFDKIYH